MGYLVDSNVIIDYVAERFNRHQLLALDEIFDNQLVISVISKIETLAFHLNDDERIEMISFLGTATIIPLMMKLLTEL